MIGYDTITSGKRYLVMHQAKHKAAELCIEMWSVLAWSTCLLQIFSNCVTHSLGYVSTQLTHLLSHGFTLLHV